MAIEESEIVGVATASLGEDDLHQIHLLLFSPLLKIGHERNDGCPICPGAKLSRSSSTELPAGNLRQRMGNASGTFLRSGCLGPQGSESRPTRRPDFGPFEVEIVLC